MRRLRMLFPLISCAAPPRRPSGSASPAGSPTSIVCDKSTYGGKYTYDNGSTNLKRAVVRAFRKAYEDNIAMTMTFTGSYALGSASRVALPKSTFTMKRKPPGGTAYRIEPSISNGPGGPQATGLTRTPSAGDFR